MVERRGDGGCHAHELEAHPLRLVVAIGVQKLVSPLLGCEGDRDVASLVAFDLALHHSSIFRLLTEDLL